MTQRGQLSVVPLPCSMHLLRIEHHGLGLILVLIDAHSRLESHLNLAIIYLLLVLLSRANIVHVKSYIVFHLITLLLVM
jgi:hypothetical protein